jgi:hypothetical protein
MTGRSRNRRPEHEDSNADTAAGPVPRSRQHSESIARAGGRAIDPLAVLHSLRATTKQSGDAGFDATAFVTAYGRTRGRAVIVEYACLSRRGVLAETWICETYDVIRVDRQVSRRNRDMVILMQWANIHYNTSTSTDGCEATAAFDVLAAAVAHHNALPAPPASAPAVN